MDNIKKLYHGSSKIIEKPLFGYGKPYNDYGPGFYCTENPDMAKEWGVGKNHNAMHLGNLGQQFVPKSKNAFEQITFIGSELAKCDEWYAKKMQRDKSARREYFNVERNQRKRGDLYITHISYPQSLKFAN